MTRRDTPINQTPPPGFRCPYLRACWQREAWRAVLTVFIAACTAGIAGCMLEVEAPGIKLETEWTWPAEAPSTSPR